VEIKDLTVHHHLTLASGTGGSGREGVYLPGVYGEIGVVEGPVEFLACFGFVGWVVVGCEVFVFEGLFCVDSCAGVEDEHAFQQVDGYH
jgi:hypothetical protein